MIRTIPALSKVLLKVDLTNSHAAYDRQMFVLTTATPVPLTSRIHVKPNPLPPLQSSWP